VRVATLAKECGVSERTLRRHWRAAGGAPLPDEINRRRIARAAHLLLLPDMAIAEVGRQVGLDSAAQFSRVFRSVRNMTPKEYRRKYLGRLPGVASRVPPFRTEFVDGAAREYDS
jgi:AraC-like DNA-binding protein